VWVTWRIHVCYGFLPSWNWELELEFELWSWNWEVDALTAHCTRPWVGLLSTSRTQHAKSITPLSPSLTVSLSLSLCLPPPACNVWQSDRLLPYIKINNKRFLCNNNNFTQKFSARSKFVQCLPPSLSLSLALILCCRDEAAAGVFGRGCKWQTFEHAMGQNGR